MGRKGSFVDWEKAKRGEKGEGREGDFVVWEKARNGRKGGGERR